MKHLLVAVCLAAFATPMAAQDYEAIARTIITLHTANITPTTAPSPAPAPAGDECPNCRGKGKVGDGTVFAPCPVCKGTGKIAKSGSGGFPDDLPDPHYPQPQPKVIIIYGEDGNTPWPNYPTSTGDPNTHRTRWNGLGSWQHLATGVHAGKFDVEWLKTLTSAELHALHDDDHEHDVKWEHVVRGSKSGNPQAKKAQTRAGSGCPGGVCPTGPGLFSRFIRR